MKLEDLDASLEISKVKELTSRKLIENFFTLNKEKWNQISSNRRSILELLETTFPKINWKTEKLFEQNGIDFVTNVNEVKHCENTTTGASKYLSNLVKIQNGKYCVLCGEKENIVVDHIVPVNQGGALTDLKNMQLLCDRCNSSKGNLANYGLSATFETASSYEKFSSRCEFLFRNFQTVEINNRMHGKCMCGKTSNLVKIELTRKNTNFEYSMLNLNLKCKYCKK